MDGFLPRCGFLLLSFPLMVGVGGKPREVLGYVGQIVGQVPRVFVVSQLVLSFGKRSCFRALQSPPWEPCGPCGEAATLPSRQAFPCGAVQGLSEEMEGSSVKYWWFFCF